MSLIYHKLCDSHSRKFHAKLKLKKRPVKDRFKTCQISLTSILYCAFSQIHLRFPEHQAYLFHQDRRKLLYLVS